MNENLLNQVHCIDCLELLAQLEDKSIDMILCDLPYGVTACAWDEIIPLVPMWEGFKRVIKKRGAIVLTATEPFASKLRMSNIKQWRYDWVWDKHMVSNIANAKIMPLTSHEMVLVFSHGNTKSMTYNPQLRDNVTDSFGHKSGTKSLSMSSSGLGVNYLTGVGYPKTIIRFMRENNLLGGVTIHPTQKPVALFEYLIKTYTLEGETVLDVCSGSGTTAIACLNLGRSFICGDSSQEYVELSRERIARHNPYADSPLKNGGKQLSLLKLLGDTE